MALAVEGWGVEMEGTRGVLASATGRRGQLRVADRPNSIQSYQLSWRPYVILFPSPPHTPAEPHSQCLCSPQFEPTPSPIASRPSSHPQAYIIIFTYPNGP